MLSRSDFRFHHRSRVQATAYRWCPGGWPPLEEVTSANTMQAGSEFPGPLGSCGRGRIEQQRTQLEIVGQVHRDDLLEVGAAHAA